MNWSGLLSDELFMAKGGYGPPTFCVAVVTLRQNATDKELTYYIITQINK